MYYIYVASGPSLLIESTDYDSMHSDFLTSEAFLPESESVIKVS